MKNMKKIVALALVLVSVMAIALPAMAASLSAVPGQSRTSGTITVSAGSTVRRSVSCYLKSGDVVRVFLDVYNPERNDWVIRDSCRFQGVGTLSSTLSYTLDDNEYKYRIRTYGYEDNSGNLTVTY